MRFGELSCGAVGCEKAVEVCQGYVGSFGLWFRVLRQLRFGEVKRVLVWSRVVG